MEPGSLLVAIIFLIIGSAALYLGAESLVKGSVGISLKLGITPLIIGLTVVAFGTSSPELIVSLAAGFDGKSEIALGNVIGSNICNIGLIIGIAALIRPIRVDTALFRRDIPIMIVASALMIIFVLDGMISRIEGGIFTLGIISYIIFSIFQAKKGKEKTEIKELEGVDIKKPKSLPLNLIMVIAGLGILAIGAQLFLEGAIFTAQFLGASEAVIGLSVVALGTSLPELATSVVASIKDESDISLGNAIGSNIFNLLMILGVAGLIFSISTEGFSAIDIGAMILLSIIIIPLALHKRIISRWNGALVLVIYIAYIYYLYSTTIA